VQERIVNPGEPVDAINHTPDHALHLRKKSFADLHSMQSFVNLPVLKLIQSINFSLDKLNTSLHRKLSARDRGWSSRQADKRKKTEVRTKHFHPDSLIGRFEVEVKIYEGNPAVRDLPDPVSDIGKLYYRNIVTWLLPPGMNVPNPRFARKHSIVPVEIPLPGGVVIKLAPTADEVVIERNFSDAVGSQSPSIATDLSAPFTPELFKDSGIDFPEHWGNTEYVSTNDRFEVETPSDLGALGDAAESPSKHLESITEDIKSTVSFSIWSRKRCKFIHKTDWLAIC
jgi:hypothetical protein